MRIEKDSVVTIAYVLTDVDGKVLEKSEPAVSYIHGGYDGIFPLVEEALHGKNVGEECSVHLTPDDGFGEYDEELVHLEPKNMFPPDVKIGMQFEGAPEGGDEDDFLLYTVTDIADGKVVVDGNHPLAGKTLDFKCTVLEVRKASAEELQHGHVHGEHGHHH